MVARHSAAARAVVEALPGRVPAGRFGDLNLGTVKFGKDVQSCFEDNGQGEKVRQ